MRSIRPCLIGIGGPSGSGKSTLAQALQQELPVATTLALDSYYLEYEELSLAQRRMCNFDHPDALDWDLIIAHLRALSHGLGVERPEYSFITYLRKTETTRVSPGQFIIVQGILALHNEVVRSLLDILIYVDAPDHICFVRRKHRDINERGRTLESVVEQYERTVRPMAVEFVIPTKKHADMIVSGETRGREMIDALLFAARAVQAHSFKNFLCQVEKESPALSPI